MIASDATSMILSNTTAGLAGIKLQDDDVTITGTLSANGSLLTGLNGTHVLTNRNANAVFVIYTNNAAADGVTVYLTPTNIIMTNYAAASQGSSLHFNGGYTNSLNIQAATINTTGNLRVAGNADGPTDAGLFSGSAFTLNGYLRVLGGIIGIGTAGNNIRFLIEGSAQAVMAAGSDWKLGFSSITSGSGTSLRSGLDAYLERGGVGIITFNTNGNFKGTVTATNGVILPSQNVALTADAQVVSATAGATLFLSSDDGTAGNRTFVLTTGVDGKELTLIWSGTNAGELVDDSANSGSGNVRLSSTWTPTQYDTLTLRAVGNDWYEVGRSDN